MRLKEFVEAKVTENAEKIMRVTNINFAGPSPDKMQLPTSVMLRLNVPYNADEDDIDDMVANDLEDRYGVKVSDFEIQFVEGYEVLPKMDRDKYQKRDGLEGPIMTRSGKVVYYDNKAGKYYDPDTDMYLSYDDYKMLDKKANEELTFEDDDQFFEEFGYLGYSIDETDMFEAEYQGRKVKLNKPMQGDVKKFKVYVKDPKTGNVKKVNFGHGGSSVKGKAMKIRKNNPKARKSFRARHNCDNPGPKTKARYWSCRKW